LRRVYAVFPPPRVASFFCPRRDPTVFLSHPIVCCASSTPFLTFLNNLQFSRRFCAPFFWFFLIMATLSPSPLVPGPFPSSSLFFCLVACRVFFPTHLGWTKECTPLSSWPRPRSLPTTVGSPPTLDPIDTLPPSSAEVFPAIKCQLPSTPAVLFSPGGFS